MLTRMYGGVGGEFRLPGLRVDTLHHDVELNIKSLEVEKLAAEMAALALRPGRIAIR